LKISEADFKQWKNDKVTSVILSYLIKERENYEKVDFSLAEMAGSYSSDSISLNLERIGLDSAMRASIVQGIDIVLNIEALEEELREEGIIAEAEDE